MDQTAHTPDHIDSAVEDYLDACCGSRAEIIAAIAAEGFRSHPAIDALDAGDRRDALCRVERGDYDR